MDGLLARAVSLEFAYDSQILNCVFLNSDSTVTGLTRGALIVVNSLDVVVMDCVFVNAGTGALSVQNGGGVGNGK